MKVLALTWEFPPVITGGLGMACYGMVKALLKQGVEVDLIMPAKEKLYFQMRKPEDADRLPAVFIEPGKPQTSQTFLSAEEIKRLIGSSVSVYQTIGKATGLRRNFADIQQTSAFNDMFEILSDQDYVFRQVRDYTEMAVDIGQNLDFDVIHAHDWLTYPAGMMLKKLLARPLVTHMHATEFDRAGGTGDGRIHHIEYMGTDYADKVIAVSRYTANIIAEKYCIGRDKTTVIHNAYSVSNPENNYRRIFKEPTVLFMGRITLQKGPDYFLEIARRVLQQDKNVRFIMAGSGDMERQVLHKAASLGMGTKFLFAGFLQRHEVENILSSTDIFILPSVAEPFGIAPLEAMSQGAVAIISKHAGVAEVIENAYKVDFWDINQMVSVIIDLVRNPDRLKEMSQQGRSEVANMDWEEAVGKIADIFCELKEVHQCSI